VTGTRNDAASAGSSEDAHALLVLCEDGAGTPLVLMHPVGGLLTEYRWLTKLVTGMPIFGIRSRAVSDPDLEHASLDAMIRDYAGLVAGAHSTRPVHLFGWSMGALLAHGVACELERRGAPVERVTMVDPQLAVKPPPELRAADRVRMAIHAFHPAPPSDESVARALRELASSDPADLVAWMEEQALLPEALVSSHALDTLARLSSAHGRLLVGQLPGTCQAPIVLFKTDPIFKRAPYDWSAHTSGTFTEHVVGGTHYRVMRPPHVDLIANMIMTRGG
jgi:thioesterase domain-containing protein